MTRRMPKQFTKQPCVRPCVLCPNSPATASPTTSEAQEVKLQGFLAHRSLSRSEDEYPFWSRPKFRPFAAVSQERICHYDELSHDRCNGDFSGFSCANELIVFCLETGIVPRCDQSGHVDGPP